MTTADICATIHVAKNRTTVALVCADAFLSADGGDSIDWNAVDNAIVARWSLAGLAAIKSLVSSVVRDTLHSPETS